MTEHFTFIFVADSVGLTAVVVSGWGGAVHWLADICLTLNLWKVSQYNWQRDCDQRADAELRPAWDSSSKYPESDSNNLLRELLSSSNTSLINNLQLVTILYFSLCLVYILSDIFFGPSKPLQSKFIHVQVKLSNIGCNFYRIWRQILPLTRYFSDVKHTLQSWVGKKSRRQKECRSVSLHSLLRSFDKWVGVNNVTLGSLDIRHSMTRFYGPILFVFTLIVRLTGIIQIALFISPGSFDVTQRVFLVSTLFNVLVRLNAAKWDLIVLWELCQQQDLNIN